MREYKKIDNISIEKISVNNDNNDNKYDLDNKIYKVGRVFKFEIEYQNIANDTLLEKYLEIEIQGGTQPFSKYDSTYSQTVIKINYLNKVGKLLNFERTGIIENDSNIWIHPPRSNSFHILQLNAFPFFIDTHSKNKKWAWELKCSYDKYQNILVLHKYSQKKVTNNLNGENKYIINSYSDSKAGRSESINEFSTIFGFTSIKFINYDKSVFLFKLKSIKERDGTYYFKE